MKRASILLLSLVVALCMALPLAGCSSNSYTPQLKEQTVDDSALNTPGTLRVGVNASNAPYAVENSGSIVGIDVDIAAALADELGLKLELVDVGTATDTAFARENVDIVMGVEEENAAYWLSDPYMNSAIALFSLTQGAQAPTAAGSFKVAAQSSSMSAWKVTDHYGEGCLESVGDPIAAFDALNTGGVNYVAADSTIGEYVVHTSDVEAYPIALLSEVTPLSIAVDVNNTALQEAISGALDSLVNGGVVSVIEGRWLGEQVDISTLSVLPAANNADTSDQTNPGEEADGNADAADASTTDDASDSTDSSSSSSSGSSTGGSGSSSSSSTSDEEAE